MAVKKQKSVSKFAEFDLSAQPSPDALAVTESPRAVPSAAPKTGDQQDAGDNLKRPPRLNIEVEVDLESDNTFYTGLTENISEGGLFVATFDLHPVGTEFNVSLTLEGMPTIEARAEVRWLRESHTASRDYAMGMGMRFLDLAEDDRATIQAFMECRAPLYMEEF